jgi:hypothetical protein
MIPAGPERDKRIAELRGVYFGNVLMQSEWSTDAPTALELFKEMPEGTCLEITKNGFTCGKIYDHGIACTWCEWAHEAPTIADAVSGAWLKWRENTK